MGCGPSSDTVASNANVQDEDLIREEKHVRQNREGQEVDIYAVAEKKEENDGGLFKADDTESTEQFMAVKVKN